LPPPHPVDSASRARRKTSLTEEVDEPVQGQPGDLRGRGEGQVSALVQAQGQGAVDTLIEQAPIERHGEDRRAAVLRDEGELTQLRVPQQVAGARAQIPCRSASSSTVRGRRVVNPARVYGASAPSFAERLGMSRKPEEALRPGCEREMEFYGSRTCAIVSDKRTCYQS
jgi:hypothetical protein